MPNGAEIVSMKLTGMDEIKAKLRQLSDLGKKRATEQAVKAGADVIKDSIRDKAPEGEFGRLKKSIVSRKKTDRYDRYNIQYQTGPDKKIAFYGHMVEFGTSRHKIIPKKGKFLRFRRSSGGYYAPEFISEETYTEAFTSGKRKISGGYVFVKGVEVSAKRHPFVRPGFDSSKFRATETIKQKLLTAIDKIAKKEAVI